MKFVITFILYISVSIYSFAQQNEHPSRVKWVNEKMLPLASYLPGANLSDLDALDSSIGSASVVALGECTHGSSEIFSMKHRMLQYLVTKKGFTIFAIEAAMPESFLLNEYILDGRGDPKKLLSGIYAWAWNTQEVLDMILWMKKYNETAANKVIFAGIDMQIPNGAIHILKNYAAPNAGLLQRINEYDSVYRKWKEIKPKKRAALLEESAKDISAGLLIAIKQPDTSWVLHNADLLKQYALGFDDNQFRDAAMAKNVQWLQQKYPGQKIMLWAHNDHIRKDVEKFGNVRMGDHLANALGTNYLAIGFTTAYGTYSAAQKDKSALAVNEPLTIPEKNSCEYIFKDAAADNFIIDLRKAKQGEAGTDWVFKKMLIRDLGAYVNKKYQFFEIQPVKDFDMLIFLKTTHSSKSLLTR